MGRPVLTAADIDQAIARGQSSVQVPADAIVTQLAREYAQNKGVQLETTPVEGSPAVAAAGPGAAPAPVTDADEVRKAVVARLGAEPEGLDAAIAKVLG